MGSVAKAKVESTRENVGKSVTGQEYRSNPAQPSERDSFGEEMFFVYKCGLRDSNGNPPSLQFCKISVPRNYREA
jgi:hypothetical protein